VTHFNIEQNTIQTRINYIQIIAAKYLKVRVSWSQTLLVVFSPDYLTRSGLA